MSEQQITHSIDLIDGYTDPKGVLHKRVVFGKSVSAKRLLSLRVDKQSSLQTQYQDLLLAETIVEFGTTKMPVPLTTLLALGLNDREDLRAGRDEFRKKVLGDRKVEIRDEGVTLLFGFKFGVVRYPIVEFGNRLTGKDEVEADKLGLTDDLARQAFLAGRMVAKLSNAEGAEIVGPVEFEVINSEDVDEDDLWGLVVSANLWRQSFRVRGKGVSRVGDGTNDSAAGDEDRLAGGKTAADAAGAA
jgi:hypothetical protein